MRKDSVFMIMNVKKWEYLNNDFCRFRMRFDRFMFFMAY